MSFILNSEVLKRKIETTKKPLCTTDQSSLSVAGCKLLPWGYSKAEVWSLDLGLHIIKEVAGNIAIFLRMKLGWPYLVSKWSLRLGFTN